MEKFPDRGKRGKRYTMAVSMGNRRVSDTSICYNAKR
jgi:hypothetical protein